MPTVYRTKDRDGNFHMNWRIRFLDWQGIRQSMVGLQTKADTLKLAWKIQAEHDEIRKGLRPPPTEAEKPHLFREMADEYLAWGNSQGSHTGGPWSIDHARIKKRHMAWWEHNLEIKWLAELVGSLALVEKVLRRHQQEILPSTGKPRAGKTMQNLAEALSSFCDWSVEREYLAADPLKKLKSFNCDPTWFRRAATLDEAKAILAVAPPYRRLIYLVAMTTGLRAGEIRKLIVKDFQDGLFLRPEITKNRRNGFQPLHQQVIEELMPIVQNKKADEPLLFVPKDTATMLYADMNKIGIKIWTDEGKLDFHALRTSFATFVIETGANVKEAQSLMRHATPEMTMKFYAKARKHPLQGVVTTVGDRLLGPGQTGQTSQTEVKQDGAQHANVAETPVNIATYNSDGERNCEGSRPTEVIGRNRDSIGQNMSQVGQQQEVTTVSPVNNRTTLDANVPTFGQASCQTDGKQIPDAVKKLADIWNQLPENVRQSIEYMTRNTGTGYSGFSGHCPGDRPSIVGVSGFSGFSGFLNAA